MSDERSAWTQDGDLNGGPDIGHPGGFPADWHTWLKTRGLYMTIQFGSIGVSRDEAERIVVDVLRGLNSRATP